MWRTLVCSNCKSDNVSTLENFIFSFSYRARIQCNNCGCYLEKRTLRKAARFWKKGIFKIV